MLATQDHDVHRYFDGQAATYMAASSRWPWSVVRSRETAAVRASLGDLRDTRVLELGAGAGHYTRLLLTLGAAEVVAVDLSEAMVAQLPRGARGLVADAAELRLDERFHHVLSAGMLEFVPDPASVLHNAARHTLPGGTLTLLVPHSGALGWAYHRYHRSHGVTAQTFSPTDLASLAEHTGWRLLHTRRVLPIALVASLELTP